MKKIRFAFAAIAATALLMTSCSSDDDGPAAKLEGKWTPTKTISITNGNQTVTTYDDNEPGCDKDYREFVEGGAYRYVIYYENVANSCAEEVVSTIWSKTGDVVTIVDTNDDPIIEAPLDAGTYTITKLTGSELRLQSTTSTGGVEFEVTQVFRRL